MVKNLSDEFVDLPAAPALPDNENSDSEHSNSVEWCDDVGHYSIELFKKVSESQWSHDKNIIYNKSRSYRMWHFYEIFS